MLLGKICIKSDAPLQMNVVDEAVILYNIREQEHLAATVLKHFCAVI